MGSWSWRARHARQRRLGHDQQLRHDGADAPARVCTWAHDSSAVTRRHRLPSAASRPSAWSSNVLFPMPGSPTRRVTDPGTTPPPSTRSSSANSVGSGAAAPDRTAPIGTGTSPGPTSAAAAARATGAATSSSVPHSPHVGQRPNQRGDSPRHCRHLCTVRVLTPATLRRGCDGNGGRGSGRGGQDRRVHDPGRRRRLRTSGTRRGSTGSARSSPSSSGTSRSAMSDTARSSTRRVRS